MVMSAAVKSREQARRRLAALTFLSNISLDGTHQDTNLAIFSKTEVNSVNNESIKYPNHHKTPPLVISSTSGSLSILPNLAFSENDKNESNKETRKESLSRLTHSEERLPCSNKSTNQSPRIRVHGFVTETKARLSGLALKKKKLVRQLSEASSSSCRGSTETLSRVKRQLSASLSDSSDQSGDNSPALYHSPAQLPTSQDARMMLVSKRKAPFLISSYIPFCSETNLQRTSRLELLDVGGSGGGRRRHLSASGAPGPRLLMTSEGQHQLMYERPAEGMEVSYKDFLQPTPHGTSPTECMPNDHHHQADPTDCPFLLDDPDLYTGKHCTVLKLMSYKTSILDYVRPEELKKELNAKFRERYPHITLTLSKMRSIKKELFKVAYSECNMDLLTLAQAFVYFERLILKLVVNKSNRKTSAAACLLLAAKINDVKRPDLKNLMEKLETSLRVTRKELLDSELGALLALRFSLLLPSSEVLPHYQQLLFLA